MEEYQDPIYAELESINLTIKMIARELNQIIPKINGHLLEHSLAGDVLCGYRSAIEEYLSLNTVSAHKSPDVIFDTLKSLRTRLKTILSQAKQIIGPSPAEN